MANPKPTGLPVDPTAPPKSPDTFTEDAARAKAEKEAARAEAEADERDRARAVAAKAKVAQTYTISVFQGSGDPIVLEFPSHEAQQAGRRELMKLRGASTDAFTCSINGEPGIFYPLNIGAVFLVSAPR